MFLARLIFKFNSYFTVITFFTLVRCYSVNLRYEKHLDHQKHNADSSGNRFFLKRDITSLRSKSTQAPNTTFTHTNQLKRWQVGRVTDKQYEIINILLRKTKIFVDVENTTPEHKRDNITTKSFKLIQGKNPIIFSPRRLLIPQSSTPSYIEFYYSDEADDQTQKEDCVNGKCEGSNSNNLNILTSSPNSSFIVFHIKGPLLARTTTRKSNSNEGLSFYSTLLIQKSNKIVKTPSKTVNKTYKINKTHLFSTVVGNNKSVSNMYVYKTKPMEDVTYKTKTITEKNEQYNAEIIARTNRHNTKATTIYDKIKFFEIYDNNTRVPYAEKVNILKFDYNEDINDEIQIQNIHKILLEHVDQSSHEHNEAKHSKKHILENSSMSNDSYFDTAKGNINFHTLNVKTETQNKMNIYVAKYDNLKTEPKEYRKLYSFINKSVSWAEYPFTAVYIYESLNVYCDAVSISAHWLVASGACLSRMNHSPLNGGRSAFVAYCGESWWQPERVSYVKYSVVHPSYHPTEPTRKHLYNIGVIQVVTSMMSACSEWAPVSLMSHQFTASQGGSKGLALGWGLDRFHARDASELPKSPLAIYRGLVYSDSCPGNIGYSKAKRAGEGGLRNVHCLSLPPYLGEDRDTVHGSLLLVGGKLIALYLQEERRQWGEQSAQYTGIWRLIPWVLEVAKEPEIEAFTVEI